MNEQNIIMRWFFNRKFNIIFHNKNILEGTFEINIWDNDGKKSLYYTYDVFNGFGGLQCQYMGGTKEYDEVYEKCKRIKKAFFEANNIAIVKGLTDENNNSVAILHY